MVRCDECGKGWTQEEIRRALLMQEAKDDLLEWWTGVTKELETAKWVTVRVEHLEGEK